MVAVYSHRAYGDPSALSLAEAAWNDASKYVITSSDVQSGSHPTRNTQFPGTCDRSKCLFRVVCLCIGVEDLRSESLEGGVFWASISFNNLAWFGDLTYI
jgi:hypothetical protein